jgi:hypothetical protein
LSKAQDKDFCFHPKGEGEELKREAKPLLNSLYHVEEPRLS